MSSLLSWFSIVWAFIGRHEIIVWILVSCFVLPFVRRRTAAEWIEMAERKPRVQGLFKAMRAAGFEPAGVLEGLLQFLTGRVRAAGIPDSIAPLEAIKIVRANMTDPSKSRPRIPPLALLLALACVGCTGANGQPVTAAEIGTEIRVIAYDAAKVLCAARPALAALSIAASGAVPALTMEPAAADLFCATVTSVENALARDAMRVLPAGQVAMVPPVFVVGAHGFSVRAQR